MLARVRGELRGHITRVLSDNAPETATFEIGFQSLS